MPLKTERLLVDALKPLAGAIKQRLVRHAQIGGQGFFVGCKAVILAGDINFFSREILHRMIRAVMTEFHFHGSAAGRECEQLMAETNAKNGNVVTDNFGNCGNRVVARLRIARTVGKKYAIGLQRDRRLCGCFGRQHGNAATALSQHAQNIVLHAIVVGDDMKF